MADHIEVDTTCGEMETDPEGQTNLCCCYFINDNGELDDPCFRPVNECCTAAP